MTRRSRRHRVDRDRLARPADGRAPAWLDVYWKLFPPTLIVFGALAVVFVLRRGRDMMLLALARRSSRQRRVHRRAHLQVAAGSVTCSSATTCATCRSTLVGDGLALPRGGGALEASRRLASPASPRSVASIPVTWHDDEDVPVPVPRAGVHAVDHAGQEPGGHAPIGWVFGKGDNFTVGIDDSVRMAAYIKRRRLPRNAVLTDDAQTFWTMLISGRPDYLRRPHRPGRRALAGHPRQPVGARPLLPHDAERGRQDRCSAIRGSSRCPGRTSCTTSTS